LETFFSDYGEVGGAVLFRSRVRYRASRNRHHSFYCLARATQDAGLYLSCRGATVRPYAFAALIVAWPHLVASVDFWTAKRRRKKLAARLAEY
jgi:hypothetical protein